MSSIDRRSRLLIAALLIAIVLVALVYDLPFAQRLNLPFFPTPTDEFNSPWQGGGPPFGPRSLRMVIRALAGVTATVGVGGVVLLLLPAALVRTAGALERQRGLTLIIGIAALLSGALLGFLAIVSLAAAVFAPFIVLTITALSAWGLLAVALHIGHLLRSAVGGESAPTTDLIIGVLVLTLVALVPFVGRVIVVLAACWGAGATVLSRAGRA